MTMTSIRRWRKRQEDDELLPEGPWIAEGKGQERESDYS